jgi:hypothetical protein
MSIIFLYTFISKGAVPLEVHVLKAIMMYLIAAD